MRWIHIPEMFAFRLAYRYQRGRRRAIHVLLLQKINRRIVKLPEIIHVYLFVRVRHTECIPCDIQGYQDGQYWI